MALTAKTSTQKQHQSKKKDKKAPFVCKCKSQSCDGKKPPEVKYVKGVPIDNRANRNKWTQIHANL